MKRTQSPEQRRQAILEAARCCLIKKGYQELKVDDVARKADIAKGTVYLYFENKNALYVGVLDDLLTRHESNLRELVRGENEPLENLRLFAEEMLSFLEQNQDFMVQFIRQPPSLTGTLAGRLNKRFVSYIDFIGSELTRGMNKKQLRRFDPFLGGLFLFSLVRMMLVHQICKPSKVKLKAQSNTLMDLFLYGLGKGTKK